MKATMKKDYSDRPLHRYFSAIPSNYDLINRLFTWRLDELWRKRAAAEILRFHPECIMDLCTGTGDLAVRISRNASKGTRITGFDYSLPMLEIAKEKAAVKGREPIEFIHGDAAEMPFPDNNFDAIGIAFAFRNLTYRNPETKNYLKEILRVLRPGGRFVIVESSRPRNPLLGKLFEIYTHSMVCRLGSILSGNRAAYRYLATSVINYYSPDEIRTLLLAAGFREVTFNRLLGGVAALHIAAK